ncbi:DUF3040 domain-containing protein [Blastococcus sp. URHD0036]|uniref:DUF3040 domain-containing protein n=1 Tax=Blastococcus sp. URHD0036 TaxID=1380356 RepID=UPI000497FBBA|nr:DUF3040 domain-containing protein [Blastococcus sp. URHD0036]
MLSSHERRVWDEIERSWAITAEETPGERRSAAHMRERARRERPSVPAWTIGAAWGAVFLLLFGEVVVGPAVAAAAVLGWAVSRWWSASGGQEPVSGSGPVAGEESP